MSKVAIRAIFAAFTMWAGLALVAAQTPKLTVIHSFTGNADGENPIGGVILDENGNIYGTTWYGTKHFGGTMFKINATGKLSVLHTFTYVPDGANPVADLVRDPQGNLYGTAIDGGVNNGGTAYKIDTAGHFSVLHSFDAGHDIYNPGGVILDSSGNLYGIANLGPEIGGDGGVFRLSKTGHETVLHHFGPWPDGLFPQGGVIRDQQGNLFGTTQMGGDTAKASLGNGTVFKLDSTRHESVLFSFPGGTEGEAPNAGVIEDAAGNLYGTTFGTAIFRGSGYYGTVFKLDANGVETVLHAFTGGADGGHPLGSLVMDSSGNLYGTGSDGGAFNKGVIFKLATDGNYAVLHSFSGSDGEGPSSDLVFDAKGTLYGTTYAGGKYNNGTVFKFTNP